MFTDQKQYSNGCLGIMVLNYLSAPAADRPSDLCSNTFYFDLQGEDGVPGEDGRKVCGYFFSLCDDPALTG